MSEDKSCASTPAFNESAVVEGEGKGDNGDSNGDGVAVIGVVVGAATAIAEAKPANTTAAKAIRAWKAMVIF